MSSPDATDRPTTIDLKREIESYRARRGSFDIVTVPPLQYLMVDGHGDPNTAPAYADALAALYPLSYALKFASKAAGRDYVVMPLEGLWSAPDHTVFTTARDKSRWDWTMLVLVPDWLGADDVSAAAERLVASGKVAAELLDRIRLETLDEGECVQTLHLGPYDAEGPVLAELHDRFVPEQGLVLRGRHHEIYLGDPRRTAPERLRTILRQPVSRAR